MAAAVLILSLGAPPAPETSGCQECGCGQCECGPAEEGTPISQDNAVRYWSSEDAQQAQASPARGAVIDAVESIRLRKTSDVKREIL